MKISSHFWGDMSTYVHTYDTYTMYRTEISTLLFTMYVFCVFRITTIPNLFT